MNKTACYGWCYPVIIYITLSVISLVAALFLTPEVPAENTFSMKLMQVVAHIIIAAIWTLILYSLCANCHYTWAWILLLLPLIAFGLILLIASSFLIFRKASAASPTHR